MDDRKTITEKQLIAMIESRKASCDVLDTKDSKEWPAYVEGLEYDNIFKSIVYDSQTANELQCLSNLFIEVCDVIDEQEKSSRTETEGEELTHILLKSQVVFDKPEQAKEWLMSICPALGSLSPVSLLISTEGRELVNKTLMCIEYGEFS